MKEIEINDYRVLIENEKLPVLELYWRGRLVGRQQGNEYRPAQGFTEADLRSHLVMFAAERNATLPPAPLTD